MGNDPGQGREAGEQQGNSRVKLGLGRELFDGAQDFRGLNILLESRSGGLGDLMRMMDEMEKSTSFSSIRLASGSQQLEIYEEDRHLTAFRDADGKVWKYIRCGFSLKTVPSSFINSVGGQWMENGRGRKGCSGGRNRKGLSTLYAIFSHHLPSSLFHAGANLSSYISMSA